MVTALAGLMAAMAGFLTWRVAHQKLKLDLYDKRFAIYEAALDFYLLKDGHLDSGDPKRVEDIHRTFIRACREAKFLFDTASGVFEALDKVRCMAVGNQPKLMTDLEAAMDRFIYFGKRRSNPERFWRLFFEAG